MAGSYEPLSRTTSGESNRSRSSFQLLQRAPSATQKSRQVDIDTTGGDVSKADISMPPPAIRPSVNPRYSRINSSASRAPEVGILDALSGPQDGSALHLDSSGRRSDELPPTAASATSLESMGTRKSDPEAVDPIMSKRMSVSSLYNTRKSAPSSVAGSSDQDGALANIERGLIARADEKQDKSMRAIGRLQRHSIYQLHRKARMAHYLHH